MELKPGAFVALSAFFLLAATAVTSAAYGKPPSQPRSSDHAASAIRATQPDWLELDDRFIVRQDDKGNARQRTAITILDGVRHLYGDADCTVPFKHALHDGAPRETLLILEPGRRHADGSLDVSVTRSLDFSGSIRTYTVRTSPGKLVFLDQGVSILLIEPERLVYEQVAGPIGPSGRRKFLRATIGTRSTQPFSLGLAIDDEEWHIHRGSRSGRMTADPRGAERTEIQRVQPSMVPGFLSQAEAETRRLLARVRSDPSVRKSDRRIVLCYPRRCSRSRGFDTCRTDIGPFCQCETLPHHFIGMCVND